MFCRDESGQNVNFPFFLSSRRVHTSRQNVNVRFFFLTNCYIFHQNVTQHFQSRVRLMAWFLYVSVPHRYLCNMHMCSGEKKKGQSTEKRNGRLYSLTVYNRKMIENVFFFFFKLQGQYNQNTTSTLSLGFQR